MRLPIEAATSNQGPDALRGYMAQWNMVMSLSRPDKTSRGGAGSLMKDASLRGEESASPPSRGTATYHVIADAEPNVVERIAQVLSSCNSFTREISMRLNDAGDVEIIASIDRVSPERAELILRKLRQLVLVHTAEMR